MKTSKPFSSISYNTSDFLIRKLDELILGHSIEFYAFIDHLPEEDESKGHKHLYIVPSGQIDTEAVRKYLEEFDPLHPEKPLRCLPCKKSRFDDWYMYSIHDEIYLTSKGQSRKYHYSIDEFVVSDDDFFIEEYHTIDRSKLNGTARLLEAVKAGKSFDECVVMGMVPFQQFIGWQKAYEAISRQLYRADRETHTPATDMMIDTDTGEVSFAPKEVLSFEAAILSDKANKG